MSEAMRLMPGARLDVEGRSCVVVRDAVADHLPPPDQRIVVLGRDKTVFFYAAEGVVRGARGLAPGAVVIGLWQLLLASQAVNAQRRLSVIYFDGEKNGSYLLRGDTVISGEVREGKPVATFGHEIDMDGADEIEPDDLELKWPEPEIGGQSGNGLEGRKNQWLVLAGLVIFTATVLGVVHNEWEIHGERLEAAARSEAMLVRISQLQERYDALRAQRVGAWPEQGRILDSFLILALRRVNFSVANADLQQAAFSVISDVETYQRPHPARLLQQAHARPRRDGRLDLQWTNAQDGP